MKTLTLGVLWAAQERNLLSWRADGHWEARAGLGGFAEETLKLKTMRQPLKITHGKMLVFFLVFWGVAKWLFCGRISAFSREDDPFDIFFPKEVFLYFLFRLLVATESQNFLQNFLWGMQLGIILNNSFYIEILHLSMLPSCFFSSSSRT